MLILPEFLISGLRLFQSRVVEGKKDFLVPEAGWELLSDRRKVRRLSLFYSIPNKSAPDHFCDWLTSNKISPNILIF
jgi:hypothetical protein